VNLYLVRHAHATPEEIDPERPLSQDGVDNARRVARFLKQCDVVSVAEIRHSTKLRARQTAEILATDGALGAPLVEVNGLEPMADVNAAILALQSVSHDLMLVGHLPYLDRLASGLVAHQPNLAGFSFGECSILHLCREEGGPREVWRVAWMLSPSLLHNRV
jgi:phosphohistidine phosphatase